MVQANTPAQFKLRLSTVAKNASSTNADIVDSGIAWTMEPAIKAADPSASLALSAYVIVKEKASSENHSVGIHVHSPDASGVPKYMLWCGNEWMSGNAQPATRDRLIKEFGKPSGRDPGVVKAIQEETATSYGSQRNLASNCGYAMGAGGKAPFDCDHTRIGAKELLDSSNAHVRGLYGQLKTSNLDDFLDALGKTWNEGQSALKSGGSFPLFMTSASAPAAAPANAPKKKQVSAAKLTPDERLKGDRIEIEDELRKRGRIFREIIDAVSVRNHQAVPELVVGPAGWGKTFAALTIGEARHPKGGSNLFDAMHYIQIQPGWESRDLIGGQYAYVEKGQQRFEVVDGPFAEAVRDAQTKRTLIILDEWPNLDPRATNLFKSTINPHNQKYCLKTDRPDVLKSDGSRGLQRIEFPVNNALFVLTGNVGEGYDSFIGDPAVRSRMHMTHFGPTTEDAIKSKDNDPLAVAALNESKTYLMDVTRVKLSERGFSQAPASAIDSIWENNIKLVRSQELGRLICPRNVARAVDLAETEMSVPRALAYQMTYLAQDLPGGQPDPKQVEVAQDLIAKAFGKKRGADLFA